MQIISGKFKGKKLALPNADLTRPSSQKTREALMSVIEANFKQNINTFVDCFAGSGAMGCEIISRNLANNVIFVENDKEVFKVLEKNVKSLKDINNYQLVNNDFFTFISRHKQLEKTILYLDPPFSDTRHIIEKFKKLESIISPSTTIILETELAEIPLPDFLQITKSKKYGRINIFFIQKA